MTSETENQPTGGNESAKPSTEFDNPDNWNYYDPDDDKKQEPVKSKEPPGNEGEQAASETTQEAEEPDNQEEAETEEPQEGGKPKSPNDDVTVTLNDGNAVTLGELKQGYFRQSDYSRKTLDLSNRRSEIEALATNTQNTMRAVSAFLETALPPRPDPMLAATNPGQYIAMKANFDNAVDMLQRAQQMTQQPQQALTELQQQQNQDRLEFERTKMVEALPQLATAKGKTQFFEQLKEIGALAGISEQELSTIDDHRYIVVMDLAREGLAARKAKQSAKAKVANVPPVTPTKQRQAGTAGTQNRDAMRKLGGSGSIKDAMLVDFD